MELPDRIDLETMSVYAASFGGPIAVVDPKQLSKTGPGLKPVIHIFTSSGQRISTINVSFPSDQSRMSS